VNFWRIRVGNPDVSKKCVEENVVAIGWGKREICKMSEEKLREWSRLEGKSGAGLGVEIRQIKDFCENISVGDKIMLFGGASIYAIGEVMGPPYRKEDPSFKGEVKFKGKEVLFYNHRKVEWEKVFDPPRKVKDLELSKKMKNWLNIMPTIVRLEPHEWDDTIKAL